MKKLLRFAGVALLALTIGGVGCGDDDDPVMPVEPEPVTPAPIVGTVSGTVSVEGSGLAGVNVSAASQSASTGSNGGYSFANVPAGTHSVQISGAPADVDFGSTAKPVTIATSGQMATADFSGTYIRTSTITGSVTAGGEGVVATVTATGMGMLSSEEPKIGGSNADGDFELTGLRAGGYMVTISAYPEGTEFTVIARNVTVGVGLSATASFDALGEGGPTTGTGVFLIITDVTDDDGDPDKTSGRVTAMIDIERGDARFEKIALYVNSIEVDSHIFNVGRAPAEEPALAAQQVGVPFKLSFDSDEYDQADPEAAVTYPNGPHRIMAGVTVVGSEVEEYSQQWDVELDNDDGVHVTVSGLGEGAMSGTGQRWYGGPEAALEMTAVPVLYSGGSAASVSVTLLTFCGADAVTETSETSFTFTPECSETSNTEATETDQAGDYPVFVIADAKVDIRNDHVFPLYLDYEGPDAPYFEPNPNKRAGGWVNLDVGFLEENKTTNKDGWLVYNKGKTGVGGYNPQLRVSLTTPSIVDGALADGPVVGVPALPSATEKDDICAVVTATDLLGNESKLPKTGACVTAAVYEGAIDELAEAVERGVEDLIAKAKKDIPAGIRAGLDMLAPTIAFSGTSPKANARNLTSEFQFQVADQAKASGLHDDPVLARVEIRDANGKMICGDGDKAKTELPGNEDVRGDCLNTVDGLAFDKVLGLVTTTGLAPASKAAYYTITAIARDNAGNHSEPESRVALHDAKPPVSLIGGAYNASKAEYNLIVSATDDFSIRDYYVALNFPATGSILEGEEDGPADLPVRFRVINPVAVDAYNSALTKTADPSGAYNAILALQGTAAETGAVTAFATNSNLMNVAIRVRDQSEGNKGYSEKIDVADNHPGTGFPVAVDPNTADAVMMGGIASFTFKADTNEYDLEDAVVLTAEVVGYAGDAKGVLVIGEDDTADGVDETNDLAALDAVLFENPFKRVDFYAVSLGADAEDTGDDELRFIHSVSGPTGTKSDATVDDDDDGVDDVDDGTETDNGTAVQDEGILDAEDERANADSKITFEYEVTISAADLYAAVHDSGKGAYSGNIIAIGVSATDKDLPTLGGVGLVSQGDLVKITK